MEAVAGDNNVNKVSDKMSQSILVLTEEGVFILEEEGGEVTWKIDAPKVIETMTTSPTIDPTNVSA